MDRAVERLLNIIFKAVDNYKENAKIDKEEHHRLARKVARECMVLLKNENNVLPLKKEGTLAVIGAFARIQDSKAEGALTLTPPKWIAP